VGGPPERGDVPQPGGLLRTKLTVPRPRPGALPRTELIEHLSAVAAPGRLTLVVAGAGWGKSTLLASWIDSLPDADRHAWLSVDEGDNDIVRFWSYVIAALGARDPGSLAASARLLAAPGVTVVDEVVPALLNELSVVTEPLTLVVDDYHVLTNVKVHRSMQLLVEQLPSGLRLVIASRTTPAALPLTRLRGQGRLAELTVAQLRLSASDAAELLRRETGTKRAPAEVDLLHARTEGWLAGLHLAALSLRTHAVDPVEIAAGFGGDDRFVGEYLHTEVLAQLPDDLRLFLRRSAVVDRFCPDLCDTLTGRSDSAELLARVERAHLFLVPLDTRGEWYRYHHLFADVLRQELHRAEPDVVPQLHRRAAEWFADHDLPLDAVRHALTSGDTARAAELVAEHGPVAALQGYADTALGWLQSLGEDAWTTDVRLCLAGMTVATLASRPAELVRWTDLAQTVLDRSDLEPDLEDEVRFRLALALWSIASFGGDSATALHHAENVERLAEGGSPMRRLVGLSAVGLSRLRAGRLQAADVALTRAGALAHELGNDLAVMTIRGAQSVIAAVGGLAHEAERLAAEAESRSNVHALAEHYDRFYVPFARGWLALQRGDVEPARDLLRRALQLVRRSPLRVDTAEVLTALAAAEHGLGDTDASRRHLDEARHLLELCPDPGYLLADPRTPPIPPQPVPAASSTPLSAREIDVIVLVAEGFTSQQIGTRLGLSRRTVEAHLATIYRKIGVTRRGAAARYAVEQGLAPARS
jgi:LuxR family maltose regulon positive regulatory protein